MPWRQLGSYSVEPDGRLFRGAAEVTHATDPAGVTVELGPAQRDLLAALVEVGPTPVTMEALAARLRKRRPSGNAVETCRLAWKRLRRFLALLDEEVAALVIHPSPGARRRGLYGLRFSDPSPAEVDAPAAVGAELPSVAYLFARSPIPTYVARCAPGDPDPLRLEVAPATSISSGRSSSIAARSESGPQSAGPRRCASW